MPRQKPPVKPYNELLGMANFLITGLARPYKPQPQDLEAAQEWLQDYDRWSEEYTKTLTAAEAKAPAVPERVNGQCAWCADPMPVPSREQGGGRTKRFCSPACKQAHHRWSRNPDKYPDAQAWTLQRRGLYATKDRG